MNDQQRERSTPLPRVSFAQNMEDVLLDRVFAGQTGTYVDVGAHHPVQDSNTYFFYLRGWRGTNLEPQPHFYKLLQECRPRDLTLPLGASDKDGVSRFYEVPQSSVFSTVSVEIAEEHRRLGFQVIPGQITVRTLSSLIAEYQIAVPDFLCVDVEGHECEVIRGTPLASWRPKVLVIEAVRPHSTTKSHQAWEPTLLENGYSLAAFNGLNRFYVRDDLQHIREVLQVPVSCMDGYVRYETVCLQNRIHELEAHVRHLEERFRPLADSGS